MGEIALAKNCRTCRRLIPVPLLLLAFVSCLDLQFESDYEDINGIELEFFTYYQYGGQKLLFRGDTGYVSRYDSLLVYDFTRLDSIRLLDVYIPGTGNSYDILDFLIEGDHAYLVLPIGLQIVYLGGDHPQVIGTLDFPYPDYVAEAVKSEDYLYVAIGDSLAIIDVYDKMNPQIAGTYAFNTSLYELEVDSNFAYVMAGNTIQIVDIENPGAPGPVYSLPFTDTLPYPLTFSKKANFLYFSARYNAADSNVLITFELSENRSLRRVSQIACPSPLRFIDCNGKYPIALSSPHLFLLNLEYPSRPCIGEAPAPGGAYAIARNDHIYVLTMWSIAVYRVVQVR